ncbi:hypothetical protein C8Q78DRAFT_1067867 [Trametes maxima]|nr:hypothetical protein C8Q78DRAFT_1067867 [Trametes maxima]
MFDFIQAGLRLILVGAASLVLALTGLILSIVAAVRTAYMRWRGIQDAPPVGPDPSSTSPLLSRDPDTPHTPSPRPPIRHRSTYASQRSPKSAGRSSRPTSPSRMRSSPEPMLPSEERPVASTSSTPSPPTSRKHRRRLSSKLAEIGLPSIDSAMEYVEPVSPVSPGRSPQETRAGPSGQGVTRALTLPAQTTSDSSSTGPSTSSIASASTEEKSRLERSRSPSRRVLQRLRDHHSQFRERCLTRVHSMPNAKAAKPAPRRTDPYQAPYYFPTPLSPDAGTYVEEVRKERQASPKVTDPLSFRQYWEPPTIPLPSPRSSPKSKEEPLAPAPPEIVVSDAPPELVVETKSEEASGARPALREVSHRWSWHLPLHPHLPKKHSVDPVQPEAQAVSEKPAAHSKFFFGHHRRRNGTASEDMQTKRTSLSLSQAS